MSHEIRTPMNAVIGFLEIVLDGYQISKEDRRHINTAYTSAKGLLSIINDILDISKLDVGKISIENIAFDIQDLCHQVFKMLEIKARKKGLDFEFEIDESMNKYYYGDPTRLR